MIDTPQPHRALSPAAQAVLNAAHDGANAVLFEIGDDSPVPMCAAAALRALADQVVPETTARTDRAANRSKIRADILGIAAELELAADGPAVPDGREPASVAAQPTDNEPTFTSEEVEMIAAPWSYLQPSLPTLIPLSERLPTEADCDAEGRCWVGTWSEIGDDGEWIFDWELSTPASFTWKGIAHISAWLPAHALPLPTAPAS